MSAATSTLKTYPPALPGFTVHVGIQARSELRDTVGWAKRMYRIPELWRKVNGALAVVAVLDTGCDASHPDLKKRIKDGKNFTKEKPTGGDAEYSDYNGHGTHCAGIIAAEMGEGMMVGVAPKAKLLIGKILDKHGFGVDDGTHGLDTLADAIQWAVDEGAQVISMSVGWDRQTHKLHGAVHKALAAGVIMVVAAGNDGRYNSENTIGYPGKYGGVITVASHNSSGARSGFSSLGGELDVMAPGTEIWSCWRGT
jgi:subtilisin